MQCPHCQAEPPADALFCHRCGARLPEAASAVVPVATAVPTYASVRDDAQSGRNIVSFVVLAEVLPAAEAVGTEPEAATAAGIDPTMAHEFYAKVHAALDFLTDRHGATGWQQQATGWLKQAGEALKKGAVPGMGSAPVGNPDEWLCTLEYSAEEAELHNLCFRQGMIRTGLETRILKTCQSCRQQRLVNPDYERMVAGKQNLMKASMLASPNILMAMARLKPDPKFVCGRCQGLKCNERIVVLCPNCGTPDTSVVLTNCPKCGHDHVAAVAEPAPVEAPPPVPAQPTAAPQPAAAPVPPMVGEGREPAASAPPTAADTPGDGAPARAPVLRGKCAKCGNPFKMPVDRIPPQGLQGKCSECGSRLVVKRPK